MTDVWLTVGIPAVVTVSTAWYSAGGRAALARRAIREDIEVARLLPQGPTREALEKVAGEKAIRYASSWIGTQKLSLRQHLILVAGAVFGAVVSWGSSRVGASIHGHHTLSGFLLGFMISGLGLLCACITYWISAIFTAEKAKDRGMSLQLQQGRIRSYVEDGEPS